MKMLKRIIFSNYFKYFCFVFLGILNISFGIDYFLLKRHVSKIETIANNAQVGVIQNDSDLELTKQKLTMFSEKTILLEESMDPENTKWSKIKKVRQAVKIAKEKFGYNSYMDAVGVTVFASQVVEWSEQYDVPIPLILAVATQESAFNPNVRSRTGAMGIMQIMPSTASEVAGELNVRYYNLLKVKDNVRFGTYYLMKMITEFNGKLDLVVRSYNCGPTYVHKVLADDYPNYPIETIDYANKILGTEHSQGFLKFYQQMGL